MTDAIVSQLAPKLTSRLDEIVREHRLPGFAVGIVRDQELAWFKGFGFADLEAKRPADEHTLHRVASITKTFTATCVLQLRDAGKLSLDDSLAAHLPEYKAVQPRAGAVDGVTLRRLLCHHAGIETEAPLPCWDVLEFPTRDELLKSFAKMEVVIPQDSAFKYSNLAFGLLGEVVARVSGRPFFDYLKAEVLDPLGMASSVFDLTAELKKRFSVGHHPRFYADGWERAPYIKLNGLAACGQLHSSVHDLARWISFQFRTENGAKVLCGRTLEEMHRPQFLEPDWSVGYCLGWRAVRSGDRVYHGHGGGIHGFASQVSFSKPHKLGAICLTNVWPSAAMLPTSTELLDAIITEIESAPKSAVMGDREVPRHLRPLLGAYVARPGVPTSLVYRDGELRLEKSPLSEYLLHAPAAFEPSKEGGPLSFRVKGGRGAGEKVEFTVNGDSVTFSLGGFVYRKIVY